MSAAAPLRLPFAAPIRAARLRRTFAATVRSAILWAAAHGTGAAVGRRTV